MRAAVEKARDDIETEIAKQRNQPVQTEAFKDTIDKINKDFDAVMKEVFPKDLSNITFDQFSEVIKKLGPFEGRLKRAEKSDYALEVNQVQKQTLNRKMSEWTNFNSAAMQANAEIKELQTLLQGVDDQGSLNEIAAEFERIKAEANSAGVVGANFASQLKQSFKNLSRYLLSFASFYRIIGTLRQGISIVKNLDSALKDVKMVVDDSTESLRQWQKTTFDSANAVGGTALDLQKSVASWIRLGKTF